MDVCLSPNGCNVYNGQDAVGRLLVGTLDGVVTLERSAPGTWQRAGHSLAGLHVSSLLLEPERGYYFAGIHGEGLYFSEDGGRSWERRMNGLTQTHVFSLSATRRDGKFVLYAGTEPAHLFRSTDYGLSWQELPSLRQVPDSDKWVFPAPPHVAHVKAMAFDPRDQHLLYAGIEQGALLRSNDDGATWRELSEYSRDTDRAYRDLHRILLRPSNPDEMYFTSGEGLYFSKNAGATWEHLTGPKFRIGYPDWLLFSPEDDRVMFMSGAATNPGQWRASHSADSTVMRTRDGGRNWEAAGTGLPAQMRANIEAMALGAHPNGFTLFAGNTDGEVFCSEDRGERWELIASGLGAVSKGGHYQPLRAAVA